MSILPEALRWLSRALRAAGDALDLVADILEYFGPEPEPEPESAR